MSEDLFSFVVQVSSRVDLRCASSSSRLAQVWTLQRVLEKKRDALSHTLFLDALAQQERLQTQIAQQPGRPAVASEAKEVKQGGANATLLTGPLSGTGQALPTSVLAAAGAANAGSGGAAGEEKE